MLTLITAPETEPLTVDDFQASLGIDPNDEATSTLILALIKSAREQGEIFTSRAFITQSWKLNLDCFLESEQVRRGALPHWTLERPLTGLSGGKIFIPIG